MVQSEVCFGILKPHMDRLEQWTKSLPRVLQAKRQTGGHPFSIDNGSLTLEIEPFRAALAAATAISPRTHVP